MESQYPPELTYNQINPKGFFSTFKEWLIEPVASGGVFWPGENVKILIQSIISGVMDPYRSHLEFEVEINPEYLPVGGLQLDSSAQSFIEQLVINSRNKEIERIPEYSVLAAWLTDCGLSEMYAEGRETEGLGYTNVESLSKFASSTMHKTFASSQSVSDPNTSAIMVSTNGLFPTQMTSTMNRITDAGEHTSSCFAKSDCSRIVKGHIHGYNPSLYPDVTETYRAKALNPARNTLSKSFLFEYGSLSNLRAEYLDAINSKKYADSTSSLATHEVKLNPAVFNSNTKPQNVGVPYEIVIPESYAFNQSWGAGQDLNATIPNVSSLFGFSSLYSPNFCKGVGEPMISPTIPQCQMKNGKICSKKIPLTKRTFKVPIISAILGLLIPEDQFVLLPIRALNEVLMEFVIDKYAMFTTGYCDISEFDKKGMEEQQQRGFTMKRVTYKMHTYQFYSPEIDEYLNTMLLNKVLLNCNMWTLGNQYQIIKGENLNNTWPIACSSEALNEVVVLFVPLDYQIYTFCRKHFRISNNITKFQLRINMDYYPSQPILGNGGNPCEIEGADNSAFIEQIFWSNNFMFNKVNPWPRINAYNFAINERCYDVTNTRTFYEESMYNGKNAYKWHEKSVNADTAMGMPFIHENRYVGKAGYVYGFEPYAHSANHLVGLDCRQVRQFDLLLNTHPYDNFPREQTMYIFTRSSVIVEYTLNGINVYGR